MTVSLLSERESFRKGTKTRILEILEYRRSAHCNDKSIVPGTSARAALYDLDDQGYIFRITSFINQIAKKWL